jgi:hypothetical protein
MISQSILFVVGGCVGLFFVGYFFGRLFKAVENFLQAHL